MSKTETQSEALTAERRLFITAVANLELRKKFGDEGFRLDLERDELEALIEMAEKVSRLDAENKALHQDAKRYRWLRANAAEFVICVTDATGVLCGNERDADAEIDTCIAAMAAAKNEGAA